MVALLAVAMVIRMHTHVLESDVQELATDVLEGIDALLEEREFQELWREAGLKVMPDQYLYI